MELVETMMRSTVDIEEEDGNCREVEGRWKAVSGVEGPDLVYGLKHSCQT